jgi:Flp pilus assembly protein TadG
MSKFRWADQRGMAMLEFVLMLPIVLVVVWGIVEVSRAWLTVGILTEAARQGARAGAVTPSGSGDVFNASPAYAAIDSVLTATGLTGATRSVTCATPCKVDAQVQATVTVTFTTALLPSPVSVDIQETTTMRHE